MAKSHVKRLLNDRSGNFGIMTAVLLPVLLGAAGVALDLTNAMQTKSAMQGLADAAALAAASSMADKGLTPQQAEEFAKSLLAERIGEFVTAEDEAEAADQVQYIKDNTDVVASQSGTPSSGQTFNITINSSLDLPLSGLSAAIGFNTMKVAVAGSAQSATKAQNALSMYLVLDRSGSMGENTSTVNSAQPKKCSSYKNGKCQEATNYVIKIDALKAAVDGLLQTIEEADPDTKYGRLGAVSYNDKMQTAENLEWGTTKVASYVSKLTASGTTNSGEAMEKAYHSLASSAEATAHKNKNGQDDPSKFIIFMTDGENNVSGADTKTKAACASAKTAGIEVYSVAFMAPAAGRKLLETCATDTSHYYDAANAIDLIAAFKSIGEKASQVGTRLTN